MKHEDVAAARYAQGLFRAAEKARQVDDVQKDLEQLSRILEPSGLKSFLENPLYPADRKEKVLEKIGGKFRSSVTTAFFHLLLKKTRVPLLYEITERYRSLWNAAHGVVEAVLTLPGEPNEAFKERMLETIQKMTKKKVRLEVLVDPAMIGGIRIRMGHRLIDGSVRTRLAEIRAKLLETQLN
jgi:F-type H+-transporting ATPase subunit delta